ncbi:MULTISPECIES: H-NS histone family protein [unclassified Janthinobacterium]|uniref:H-NS histone family protein n=1 Tax=unclassified Janthinobacterium TaxID=2610881 RepID=UPI00028A0ACD|nr:H-NS histone family protein [Janthinobacterium sp. CG_23.4]MDH6159511.1 DNA-binding protein H-NS [Janthinobacterium sp. CG_23.4]
MDLSTMTMLALRKLEDNVKQELISREREDLNKARVQIMAIAQQAGIALKQLMLDGLQPRMGKVAVRYRNADNATEQWTGRGRQPRWVKKWVESDKSIDLLRV